MGVHTKTPAGIPPSPTLPHKGGGSATAHVQRLPLYQDHGSTEIGEKSMNQLFGCTTPLTFGLMARGPTSWAT